MELIHGDCLEKMDGVPDKSIDMVLADIPYGTTACGWDIVIPLKPMWEQLRRIIKENGAILLFGNQPFTSLLINSNLAQFRYDWCWKKSRVTNVLNAKRQPLRIKEDILVFYSKQPVYNPQGLVDCDKMTNTGATAANQAGSNATGKITQTETGNYRQTKTGYPKNIIEFSSPVKTVHPTQKPIPLMEYLIKTYTNRGGVVLDFAMGSGTTGVACQNLGRDFIGIEKDNNYFEIACSRIREN